MWIQPLFKKMYDMTEIILQKSDTLLRRKYLITNCKYFIICRIYLVWHCFTYWCLIFFPSDLNLDYEQGERGFVRDQIKNQETEIKRRSTHDPTLQSSLDKILKSTTFTMVESTPDDDVFSPPSPRDEGPPPPEIPNVETRTVIYEPNTPTDVTTLQMTGSSLFLSLSRRPRERGWITFDDS